MLTNKEQEKEFNRRRNIPDVEVRKMFTKRTNTYQLSRFGVDFGSKTEVLTRGKVTSTLYVLPELTFYDRIDDILNGF
jgi:hypothetical protein